jgi:hypothetical protein
MMTITYLFIALGIVSIGFLIYMFFRSFNEIETTTTITKPHPIPGGESIKYASSLTMTLGKEPIKSMASTTPKKEFTPNVKTYRKNVRVDNIIVENRDDIDMVDMVDPGMILDVADAVDTMIDCLNTNNNQGYPITDIDATPSFPDAVIDVPTSTTSQDSWSTSDNYSAPVQDSWSPSDNYSAPVQDSWSTSDNYSAPVQDSWSPSPSSFDSGSSSFDSGSSSFDSGSSSFDSSW